MKNRFFSSLVILAILIYSCNSSPEKESQSKASKMDSIAINAQDSLHFSDDINSTGAIRTEYEKTLQAVKSGVMDSTSFTYDCHGEKSGTVTYYRKGGILRMIEREYAAYSHTHGMERYFVSAGKPYFVYRKNTDWAFKSSDETVDDVTERRFFILGDTLAQCLTQNYEIHSDENDNPDPQEMESNPGQCPPVSKLMDQFELLLSHKDETGEIACLQQ